MILLLLLLLSSGSNGAEILLHPKSRLAAIGVEVTFHCKINNSIEPYWVVNNQAAYYAHQRDYLAAQGFFFEERHKGGVAMLTVKVNATADKNETQLYCISLPWPGISSRNATLLIILDPPVSPNPSVTNPTSGSIMLKWSPPFLWPGLPINYYVVYITNTKGESTHHLVNTSFSDAAVSFTIFADEHDSMIEACDDLHFSISAVSSDQEKLQTFTASGGYIPINSSNSLEVNITVLFDTTILPHVVVSIEVLPMICDYQELCFTIFVTNGNQNVTQLGPYHHRGPDAISQTISSGLETGNEYRLWASVQLITGPVTSDELTFDTNFNCPDAQKGSQSAAKYIMISVVALIGVLFLMMLLMFCAIHWNRKFNNERERPSLVVNPIYESADRYQNLHTRLHPHTINTAQQSSIYSVVADLDERSDEECQKSARESAENVSVDGGEKYNIMNQIATDDGCADNNKY